MLRLILSSALLLGATSAAVATNTTPPSAAAPMSPAPAALQTKLVEPHLHITRSAKPAIRVALTFDACMGKTDARILNTLVEQHVPATIFVTGRWLKTNPDALAIFLAHPDLFELEDHGLNHIPAVDRPTLVYGIAAAGSPDAVAREVQGGADAMQVHGIAKPHWFRGATAKYSLSAIAEIRAMGYDVAGYSINGDSGASLPAAAVTKQYLTARDGDVLISHINQPTHSAGEGVVNGILALKAKGVQFVRLQDATDHGDDHTTE